MAGLEAASLARRFTDDEFVAMLEAGLFSDDRRVELIDGFVLEKPRKTPEHVAGVQAVHMLLAPAVASGRVLVQQPFALSRFTAPEPDLAVVADFDPLRLPSAAELLVEVVVSDRRSARMKVHVYAQAGIERYWIVDVPGRRVEVFSEPDVSGYDHVETLSGDDVLEVPTLGLSTTVAALFARVKLQ